MKNYFAIAATASYANAFWSTAHLLSKFLTHLFDHITFNIVARRAQKLLEDENPDALSAALDVLATLKDSHPDIVKEGDNPFTECATFADEIKSEGYSF